MTTLRRSWPDPEAARESDPRIEALGRALLALAAQPSPIPWSAIRLLGRALLACGRTWPVEDPQTLIDTALAAAGATASSAERAIMAQALVSPVDLITLHVPPPRVFQPQPATGPEPRPLSPAQLHARRQLRAFGEHLVMQGSDPVPLAWKVAILGHLRAGYGAEAGLGPDEWYGFTRDVVARALWNAPVDRLNAAEAAAFANLVGWYRGCASELVERSD
ncbi:MAG: hypothetical protein ACP5QO_14505 [Clostridia bacterium]